MKFSVIVAIDSKNGFAKDNKIPWYFKEDFIHFKKTTGNSPCVMGRNTYNEINEKLGENAILSVLPNRPCFVLSNTLDELPNAIVIKSLDDLNWILPKNTTVFLIGGKQIFDLGIKIADNIIITKINKDYSCDMFFDYNYVKNNYKIINIEKSTQQNELNFVYFSRNENDQH